MLDKWEELKLLIDGDLSWPVHFSHSRDHEKSQLTRVKEWMAYLEKKETESIKLHIQTMAVNKKEEGFLYTDIPSFDQTAWDKILEEKGLQGLS